MPVFLVVAMVILKGPSYMLEGQARQQNGKTGHG
jgi:hypothetical protein